MAVSSDCESRGVTIDDGCDDYFGSGGGIKNTVTIVTTVTRSNASPFPPRRAHDTLQPQDESIIVGYYTSAEVLPQPTFFQKS